MLMEHRGRSPMVDERAFVAPSAIVSGAVSIGPGARVLHGAVLSAEDGEVSIGGDVVVMEHALIRARSRHPVQIGASVMVGPRVYVNGAVIADGVFLATGSTVFPGAFVGAGAEVRVNAVVQVMTRVAPGAVIPIGWVAVGDPAEVFPPEAHEQIWAIQRELDFPGVVYGVDRSTSMPELMAQQSAFYGMHRADRLLEVPSAGDV